MLVGAGEKKDVLSDQSMIPGEDIGCYRGICMSDMGDIVDIGKLVL